MSGGAIPGTDQATKTPARGLLAATLLLALFAGGCSTNNTFSGTNASDSTAAPAGFTDKISSFFSGASAKAPQTVTNAQPDVNCPSVQVRSGASALTIGATDDKSAMTLKYQGEFAREARECTVAGGNMVMKVGVQGRVIVGPSGGPGQVDVPLRIAVVEETPGGTRPIMTKFVIIPVVIAPGAGNVPFTHIEEALTFPVPSPTALLDDYIVYVGFDPQSAEAQSKPKPPPRTRPRSRPKPKPKPQPAASAN
jgi:hypothetical protein